MKEELRLSKRRDWIWAMATEGDVSLKAQPEDVLGK